LLLAYVLTAAIYSITEAGFRMLDTIWIFLLLAVVAASSASNLSGDAQQARITLAVPASGLSAKNAFDPTPVGFRN
jgi:hypothetical protein